jgi:arsenate reductase (thioredoxin)
VSAPTRVLILCTGNSARSILGELLLRERGRGRFETASAGAAPKGEVHPLALRVLREDYGIDASGARSKSWDELRGEPFDLVLTVCDSARDACPVWPGRTLVAHWGQPDPAAVEGTEAERLEAFRRAARILHHRIQRFLALPFETLDRPALERAFRDIGEAEPPV